MEKSSPPGEDWQNKAIRLNLQNIELKRQLALREADIEIERRKAQKWQRQIKDLEAELELQRHKAQVEVRRLQAKIRKRDDLLQGKKRRRKITVRVECAACGHLVSQETQLRSWFSPEQLERVSPEGVYTENIPICRQCGSKS